MISAHRREELSEIKRLSVNVYVLIDSERQSKDSPISESRMHFMKDCETLGFNVTVTKLRALENYLSDKAIKSAFGEDYKALDSYQLLKEVSKPWEKSESWRVAREMGWDEIEQTDLGQ